MSKLKLALLGTRGIPAKYGGGETLYENLVRGLADRYDITVYCCKEQPRIEGDTYLGARLKYLNIRGNGWQSIVYDCVSAFHASKYADILYVFGPASAFAIHILRLFGFKKPIIMNCGGLNEWEREKFSGFAKAFLKWGYKSLRGKVVYLADNELYARSLRDMFGVKDITVIRYGGDNAVKVPVTPSLLEKYPFLLEDYFVSVARAQVDNNLHMVLEAFSQMPDKKLVLVSNFQVSDYGKELYGKYKDSGNMVLIPGVYDQTELNAIRSNAKAYIHSHSRCGTPPSLCEAMNLGLPVISFEMPVNHEVTGGYAFFFSTAEELVTIVENKTDDDYAGMAALSHELALRELTWEHIWAQYIDLFDTKPLAQS